MSVQSLPESIESGSVSAAIGQTLAALNAVILGKEAQTRLALACLLARGHLLIEDVPGVGKTTLARALSAILGLSYKRIQFTSDMLPADIIGVSVYRRDKDEFEFHQGPVFSEMVLADEVNRATPKAQSALLEAMQEGQVSVDGQTYTLPKPFFVVATQNPSEQSGTFALPESQLDRFMLRIELGYPDAAQERALLAGHSSATLIDNQKPVLNPLAIRDLQQAVDKIHVSEPMLDYLQALVDHSRNSGQYKVGLSPRGALAMRQAACALALIEGRSAVYPDDIQSVVPAIAGHRLSGHRDSAIHNSRQSGEALVAAVPIP